MKSLSPVPCPPLVKVEKKNPPENERCGLSFLQERRVEGTEGGEVGGCAVEHTLTCYWGVRQRCVSRELEPVLSIDPEMRRAARENVETGGKRTGLGKDSKGRGWGQRDDGEGKKERSEEAPSSCIRLVYISMSRDALCGQSVGSHFCQWSQRIA